KPMRGEIDRLNEMIYANVNNGVYRCGFAKSQAAYEASYDALFATLDELEVRLSRQRYLLGRTITEADWRLFPTLVRFDVAYFSLFRCNKKRIADYPNLASYMRDLYQMPGIAETVRARYYVINYWSIARLNPMGIIPKGTPVDYSGPHDRARLASYGARLTSQAHFCSFVGEEPDVEPVLGLVVFLRSSYLGWPMCFLVEEAGDPFSMAFAGVNKVVGFNSLGATAPL